MKLVYSQAARKDLLLIFDYIASNNRRAAEETILRIEQTLLLVCQFPEMGRTGDNASARHLHRRQDPAPPAVRQHQRRGRQY